MFVKMDFHADTGGIKTGRGKRLEVTGPFPLFAFSLSHKVYNFLSVSLVHLWLRIDWIMRGTRGNMLLPKEKRRRIYGRNEMA